MSLVREDGTKASTHGDYKRAQQTCRELEVKYGLEQLSTLHAVPGAKTAARDLTSGVNYKVSSGRLQLELHAGAYQVVRFDSD